MSTLFQCFWGQHEFFLWWGSVSVGLFRSKFSRCFLLPVTLSCTLGTSIPRSCGEDREQGTGPRGWWERPLLFLPLGSGPEPCLGCVAALTKNEQTSVKPPSKCVALYFSTVFFPRKIQRPQNAPNNCVLPGCYQQNLTFGVVPAGSWSLRERGGLLDPGLGQTIPQAQMSPLPYSHLPYKHYKPTAGHFTTYHLSDLKQVIKPEPLLFVKCGSRLTPASWGCEKPFPWENTERLTHWHPVVSNEGFPSHIYGYLKTMKCRRLSLCPREKSTMGPLHGQLKQWQCPFQIGQAPL